MSGSATFTTVTSTRSMKAPVQIATSGNHVRTDEPCPIDARYNRSGEETSVMPAAAASAPEEPETDPAAAVLGHCRHVDDLPRLLLHGHVGQDLQVPPELAERGDRRLHLRADVPRVGRRRHVLD